MKTWQDIYKSKVVSAEEAVKVIKSGDRVVQSFACGEPQTLVEAMVKRGPELEDVEIDHMIAMGPAKYCLPENEKSFRHRGFFIGASTRAAVNDGRADFVPVFFFQIPWLYKRGILPVDVAIIQLTPPDKNGWCSLGVCADYTIAAMDAAKCVIAEVNEQYPRTQGRPVHVSELDYIVESNRPIIQSPRAKVGEVEKEIAKHVSSLVDDGATLQMGIGSIPEAVATLLTHKVDLGVHTEMLADWCVDLAEAGALTGRKKSMHPFKIVATFVQGTQRLYDFVHENPTVDMMEVDYTNDPWIISRQHKMVSINSALQVDLQGQVCADSIGVQQYSGVGGQVDYIRGAAQCPDGVAIIAVTSTAGGGKFSRIVPWLEQGASVTTSRNDVHYVVTEYGIADMRFKTLRERADALISIAHPDFRAELRKEMNRRHPGFERYNLRTAQKG
jgi:4-hydroxybutyrate CoA-transferase